MSITEKSKLTTLYPGSGTFWTSKQPLSWVSDPSSIEGVWKQWHFHPRCGHCSCWLDLLIWHFPTFLAVSHKDKHPSIAQVLINARHSANTYRPWCANQVQKVEALRISSSARPACPFQTPTALFLELTGRVHCLQPLTPTSFISHCFPVLKCSYRVCSFASPCSGHWWAAEPPSGAPPHSHTGSLTCKERGQQVEECSVCTLL